MGVFPQAIVSKLQEVTGNSVEYDKIVEVKSLQTAALRGYAFQVAPGFNR